MSDRIHSVIVSYERVDLTIDAISSYYATVTIPHSLVIVDNGTQEERLKRLRHYCLMRGYRLIELGQNRYPGYATNFGWALMPRDTTLLHRADNDFVFLPGWCEEVQLRFRRPGVGQVGLRTDEEELFAHSNVGGNNVIRRTLWDQGLRYIETPWPEIEPRGYTEDSFLSAAVDEMGWQWTRVMRPCILPISREDPDDPYYAKTWSERGITPPS